MEKFKLWPKRSYQRRGVSLLCDSLTASFKIPHLIKDTEITENKQESGRIA